MPFAGALFEVGAFDQLWWFLNCAAALNLFLHTLLNEKIMKQGKGLNGHPLCNGSQNVRSSFQIFLPFVNSRERAISFLLQARSLFLNFLYFESMCIMMYDIFNNHTPENLNSLFKTSDHVQRYKTR